MLGDNVHLLVSHRIRRRKADEHRTHRLLSPDPKVASPHEPYEIELPDGIGTYGIVWERGAGVLWVIQKGLVRKQNFTNPAQVKETRFEPGRIIDVPEPLRDALRKVFEVEGAPSAAAGIAEASNRHEAPAEHGGKARAGQAGEWAAGGYCHPHYCWRAGAGRKRPFNVKVRAV